MQSIQPENPKCQKIEANSRTTIRSFKKGMAYETTTSDRIRFDYGQVVSAGTEGTIVRIEWL